jgi:hypothetical protein
MGYKLAELFEDRTYWLMIVIFILSILAFLDLLFQAFHLIVARISLVFAALLLTVLVWKTLRRDLDRRRLQRALPRFEAYRRDVLKAHLRINPHFQTRCSECRHFSETELDCGLYLPGRLKMTTFGGGDAQQYCLYWNADLPVYLT